MINLVPSAVKRRQGVKSLVYVVLTVYFVLGAVVILGLAALKTYALINRTSLESQQSELNKIDSEMIRSKELTTKAAFVEQRLNSAAKYRTATDPSEILQAIATATPINSKLTIINITSPPDKGPTVTVSGFATERRSIVLFKDKLSATEPLANATISALNESDIAGVKTYTFSVTVFIKKR